MKWLCVLLLSTAAFAAKDYYAEGPPSPGTAQEIGTRYVDIKNAQLYVCTSTNYSSVTHATTCNWTNIQSGGSIDLTAPGPIGSVTPNSGAFTSLSNSALTALAPICADSSKFLSTSICPSTSASYSQLSVTGVGVPSQVILTPSGTSQATVAGAAILGVPDTVTTPGVYNLPAAPATGVYFGTNSSGIVTTTIKTQQGTGSAILSSSTVSGTAATLCTDANGSATTAGCGAGGGAISGLTNTKIPVASSATTMIDSSVTDTGGLLSTSNVFKTTGAGAASTPMMMVTGALPTGTATTAFPGIYYDCNGSTQPTTFSTNTTVLGANTCTGFNGNWVDFISNGSASHAFQINSGGTVTIGSGQSFSFSGRSRFTSSGDGILTGTNAGGTGLTRFNFGLTSSSGPALCVSGTVLTVCAGDGTAVATLGNGTTTVAALPAAAAGNKGQQISVSDSTTVAAEGQTCVGGSTNTALAFSNGVVWKCF